jgi:hypothetical protein
MTINSVLRPESPSDRIRWITRKGDPSGLVIVASLQLMKSLKSLIQALAYLALAAFVSLVFALILVDAILGGVN